MYTPSKLPEITDVEVLRRAIENELEAIAREMSEMVAVDLRPVFAAPLRPRDGMIVFADGTSWNPGLGRGLYVYNTAAWVKI
jgi:hypothetical protein